MEKHWDGINSPNCSFGTGSSDEIRPEIEVHKGLELIMHYEGLRLEAYPCPGGQWTIGYGHTKGVKKGDKITKQQAIEYLVEDFNEWQKFVLKRVKIPLNCHQLWAATSFAYNTGGGYISKGKWTPYQIWALIDSKKITSDYWHNCAITAGGKKLNGLIRRRKSEWELFENGKLNWFI